MLYSYLWPMWVMRVILNKAISMIPVDCRFYSVIDYAYKACEIQEL